LAVKNTIPLERWRHGVSIMLEKSPGNINVSKLKAILLLEADFILFYFTHQLQVI